MAKIKIDNKEYQLNIEEAKKLNLLTEIDSREYIDLGLPSGKLWASENEDGQFTFDEAIKNFPEQVPTKEDFQELYNNCKWSWDDNNYRMIVTGSNKESIFFRCFPADISLLVQPAMVATVIFNCNLVGSGGFRFFFNPSDGDSLCLCDQPRHHRFPVRLIKKNKD